MNHTTQVALMFPARISHLEASTQGIAEFARRHGGWTFIMRPDTFTVSLRSLKGWNGSGAIALIEDESEAAAAKELTIPVVNLSGSLRDAGLPRVTVDNEAVGRLAADHLVKCGFHRFAFYGTDDLWYSQLRRRGFVETLKGKGCGCEIYATRSDLRSGQPWHYGQKDLERWLAKLETPIGLLACDDHRARMVSEACSRLGLNVPNHVGIIGVDNEQLICEFCVPPLSSIARSDFEVGFEAAALLSRIMSGQSPPASDILIPPEGVIRRHSTDIVGVDDPHVAAAVRFIRENLDKQFGVKQLAAHVSVSRRSLEQGFRTQLDCTPHEYLCRLRVERAKQLLAGSIRMKISQVARACGFNNPLQLRRAFKRSTGSTPQRFREEP